MNQPYQPTQTPPPIAPAGHTPTVNRRDFAMDGQRDVKGLDFLVGERGEFEFQKAAAHSGLVRFLKVFLPVLAVLIILLIAGALVARQFMLPNLDISNIEMNDGKLIMENPKLNGVDQNQRPYNLSADRAIQDASNPSIVELQRIIATLPMEQNISADITAGNGVYDAEAKTLKLKERVTVNTSDGMSIELMDADVDIQSGAMTTNSPIKATSPQADIASSSMIVDKSGERLIFEGNVKMTLRPKALRQRGESTNEQN